jgi:glutamate racemase
MDYLRKKLSAYDLNQYGTVVLGCTHFPFYRKYFRQLFTQDTDIIDGSRGTINYLRKTLSEKGIASLEGQGDIIFFSSGQKVQDDSRYRKYLNYLGNS